MSEPAKVNCQHCGANVPLLDARRVRCLYCLEEVEVPAGVRLTLGAQSALAAELEATTARLLDKRTEVRRQAAYVAALALLYAAPLSYVLYVTYGALAAGDPHYSFQVGFWGVGLYSVVFAAFAATALRWRSASVYALAKLRPAALAVREGVVPLCPSCGAGLALNQEDVTSTCGHCGTQSLLPATLVADGLQRKHTQVVNVRVERASMGRRFRRGGNVGGRIVGWGLVLMSAAYAALNPLWNLYLFPVAGADAAGFYAGTAVFAGMMLFAGVVTVVNSREAEGDRL